MRKGLLGVLISFSFLLFIACGDDKENLLPVDEEWKKENEAFITKIDQRSANSVNNEINPDGEFTKFSDLAHAGYIYCQEEQKGHGIDRIVYGDSIWFEYEGSLIDETIFDSRLLDNTSLIGTAKIGTDSFVPGFTTALQHMREGDKWDIWIPQELGYGRTGSTDRTTGEVIVPPYSALKFYLHIVKVKKN